MSNGLFFFFLFLFKRFHSLLAVNLTLENAYKGQVSVALGVVKTVSRAGCELAVILEASAVEEEAEY